MCGIVGIIDPALPASEIQPTLQRMNDIIVHRGPDDDGFFLSEGIGLGMRRLSIIDLGGGKQPIYNEDRSIVIVFNGEIYNYRELTQQLKQRGHVFTTMSDTEVIVHLYEEVGEACVDQLRGMFAFAVWDMGRRKLFIARDRLGIKPLYYTQMGDRLIFGSEIKSILQHPDVEARLDLEGLNNFLSLKYVPAPRTMFEGIQSLQPGHTLTWHANTVAIKPYWDLSFANSQNGHLSEEAYAEQLEALIRESVKLRLRSDVPFGAFLSGGVDSSTVVAIMSQFLDEPVKTFSVGFHDDTHVADELPFARLVAKQYQTDHHEIYVGPQDFIDLMDKVAWHLDQPIADQATVATYMVSKLASSHVKMVLTGEGGDELFAGYARYAGERFSPYFRHIPASVKSLALAMSDRLPGLHRPKIALYALCQPDETTRFTNWFPLFNYDRKMALLSDDLRSELYQASSDYVFAEYLARTDASDALNRMLYVDTKLWLPDYLLLRGDKLTMATSLEGRVPLLDHKVVEFAASLPPHLKLNGLARKYLLKKVSRKLLPPEIIDRKKEGFPIPIYQWLRTEANSLLRDYLSPETVQRRGLFNQDYVTKLLDEYQAGVGDHGHLLWGLLSVELWHRNFIDTPLKERIIG
jgi:asparagine synthase (glutamine-hydrolysing)